MAINGAAVLEPSKDSIKAGDKLELKFGRQ